MNPKILPPSMWLPYEQEFRVANAGTLVIKLKSKPIIIEIFPGCQITTEVLGSTAPGKDLILGWDSYHLLKKQYDISIEPRGVKWRSQFKPFTTIPRFYSMESSMAITFDDIKEEIAEVSCADSHNEFLQKCKNPLWLNPAFFVSLPFKENLVTTPTKASHAGMNPSLLQQANEECDQLISQGIVSQTNSPWACKAFYVNNRAEQARGKLRLVIDYKPLNQYLQDVKFPLPSRRSLLQHLSGATIFSKFDLKSGFWQLGVQPEERYKTAFCLPNRHLEWKVLPFGLKTAPSLFQQAMLRIFKPLIHTALVYIDDILLFSNNEAEHMETLRQFHDIVKEYGIMLSARKMIIAKPSIEFLGVHITNGQFVPQAHLATELLDFPEENLTRRQVQQFLGVINYLSDFIPKLSELTNPLRKMLKKNPPQWSPRQTEAVKRLKIEIQKLPPLKIPSTGKRIIQTDASDKYWGAILFEETDGKRQICGYRSGRFKDSEMHYHSTFKEILAVKRAIEKFEFHLIGQKFRIEMDMSSFPKMLQFKQKTVPHQQLLRWSEWFSKYEFESAYLKGTRNILADMLSRNPVNTIYMMTTLEDTSDSQGRHFDFEKNMPKDAQQLIDEDRFHQHLRYRIFYWQGVILSKHGNNNDYIAPLGINPDYPFAHLYRIRNTNMPEEVLCFLWYLCAAYSVGIIFDIPILYKYVNARREGKECLATFLRWFDTLSAWSGKLRNSAKAVNITYKRLKVPSHNVYFDPHTIYFFHRPINISPKSKKVHATATLIHHKDLRSGFRPDHYTRDLKDFEEYQLHAFRLNNSKQRYAIPYQENWSYYDVSYQMDLDESLSWFFEYSQKKEAEKKEKRKFYTKKPDQPSSSTSQLPQNKEEFEDNTMDDTIDSESKPSNLYQDAQGEEEPNMDLDLDGIGKMFDLDAKSDPVEDPEPIKDPEEPEYEPMPYDDFDETAEFYLNMKCPNDHYGCCEKHMIKFEMEH